MNQKLRRWLWLLGALFLTGFVALNVLAYRHAYAMMHFTRGVTRTGRPEDLTVTQKLKTLLSGVSLPRPDTTAEPSAAAPECKALILACTNGIKLGTWYSPGDTNRPVVLFFHGYGGNKTSLIPEAKSFLGLGCSVMLVDFRGSGDSSESYTTVGFKEAEDIAAVVGYAKNQLHQSRIILYGQSMGAAALLRAIHSCGVQPDGIIVEAVFDRMLGTVKHRFEAMHLPSFPGAQLLVFWGGYQVGFNGFNYNPVEYAAAVRCPSLFLHGAGDPRAHAEEARQVFNAIPAPPRSNFGNSAVLGTRPPCLASRTNGKKPLPRCLPKLKRPHPARKNNRRPDLWFASSDW